MDRISAALVVCIIMLIGINAAVIYNTWLDDDSLEAIEIYSPEESDLIFKDDTSIECAVQKKLWIRAKVVYSKEYDAGGYEIISKAVDDGYWEKSGDGWYYCKEGISMGQETRPLLDSLLYQGEKAERDTTGKFRMKVEAVDEAWLDKTPDNSRHAFKMLEELYSEQDIKELL